MHPQPGKETPRHTNAESQKGKKEARTTKPAVRRVSTTVTPRALRPQAGLTKKTWRRCVPFLSSGGRALRSPAVAHNRHCAHPPPSLRLCCHRLLVPDVLVPA